jgi:hypothetical protein
VDGGEPSGFSIHVKECGSLDAVAPLPVNREGGFVFFDVEWLVHRVKGSRRYKADPSGVQAMCAYLILRDKVIKPLLAGVVRPFGPPPKNQTPVDQHYVRLREELNRTFETIGLAPA